MGAKQSDVLFPFPTTTPVLQEITLAVSSATPQT